MGTLETDNAVWAGTCCLLRRTESYLPSSSLGWCAGGPDAKPPAPVRYMGTAALSSDVHVSTKSLVSGTPPRLATHPLTSNDWTLPR